MATARGHTDPASIRTDDDDNADLEFDLSEIQFTDHRTDKRNVDRSSDAVSINETLVEEGGNQATETARPAFAALRSRAGVRAAYGKLVDDDSGATVTTIDVRCIICYGAIFLVSLVVVSLSAGLVGFAIGYRMHQSADNANTARATPLLILISIDGFRYSYLNNPANTFTTLRSLIEKPNTISGPLTPQFPTVTFPNHWTLVTGLHPINHGVTANQFYDKVLPAPFCSSVSNMSTNSTFWLGEPVWTTAQQYGIKTAIEFWPGSQQSNPALQPNRYTPYDPTVTPMSRVNQTIAWILSGDCQLCLLYFDTVDRFGHIYGPDSIEVTNELQVIDNAIGNLITQLTIHQLIDTTHIIIVSDHGMSNVNTSIEKQLFIDDYIKVSTWNICNSSSIRSDDTSGVYITSVGPIAQFDKPNDNFDINNILNMPHVTVYSGHNNNNNNNLPILPSSLYYTDNERIADVILVADDGYVISDHQHVLVELGAHGYPDIINNTNNNNNNNNNNTNNMNNMTALLIISSPKIFQNYNNISPVDNIHIYELLCFLLNIPSALNNGSIQVFKPYFMTKY